MISFILATDCPLCKGRPTKNWSARTTHSRMMRDTTNTSCLQSSVHLHGSHFPDLHRSLTQMPFTECFNKVICIQTTETSEKEPSSIASSRKLNQKMDRTDTTYKTENVSKANRQRWQKANKRANETKAERSTLIPLRLKYRSLFVHHQKKMYTIRRYACVQEYRKNRNCTSLLGLGPQSWMVW